MRDLLDDRHVRISPATGPLSAEHRASSDRASMNVDTAPLPNHHLQAARTSIASRPKLDQDTHAMLVTIGMPVYNGAATIAAALDCLLAQTVADFELVISDNGSTDATETICRRYAARDQRIRYVRQPVNLGAAMNFRYVLFAARTPYFMWAAADDLWAREFIATHLHVLENDPGTVASQCKVLFTKAGRPSHISTGTYALTGSERENLARFLFNPADNSRYYALFRTAALQEVFPDRNFYALDWGVSAATLRHGTHQEIDQVLMIRGSSDAAVYGTAIRRDHKFILARIFPILFLTKWLILTRRIPLNGAILSSLLRVNLYIHFRLSTYRIGWLAEQYLTPQSPLRRAVAAVVRPCLGSRLRKLRARLFQPVPRIARAVWRRLPLSLPQREGIKRRLVRNLGRIALRIAATTG
jgi:glycosyltransferase involved in cell wall biosynthesis